MRRFWIPLAMLAASVLFGGCRTPSDPPAPTHPYRDATLGAARWLTTSGIEGNDGTHWPIDPRHPEISSWDLYGGTPGVILFFLEAWRHTGIERFRRTARAGADELVARLAAPPSGTEECGLWVGLAGAGFVLEKTHEATGERRYRDAALECVRAIHAAAGEAGAGVEWSDVTDIVQGSAGIGLFLLYAARDAEHPASRDLAVRAGRRLVELAVPADVGRKWRMDPEYPRLMPNFSHGTAGVAYFLATLFEETGQMEFLDAARDGVRYLESIADTSDDGCRIFHDEPDGRDLYYLGWCHGPVGTARLFFRLYRATGERTWLEWAERGARSIENSGIPERLTDGFWNNVGQCCGSAGVIEFFVDLHRVTGRDRYLAFAKRMADDLLDRATEEGSGLKWVQAEHRRLPDLLAAQTGYMHGASGIGMALLHLDAAIHGGPDPIVLPDDPFSDSRSTGGCAR